MYPTSPLPRKMKNLNFDRFCLFWLRRSTFRTFVSYNFRILIFDSDLPGAEQESINATIKSLRSNTLTVETNEDEEMDIVLGKIREKLKQYKLNQSQ